MRRWSRRNSRSSLEIRIDQAIGLAAEAELDLPVATDDSGVWSGQDDDFSAPFHRIRVEVQIGDGDFVPLIDGPVVAQRFELKAEPNDSHVTVVVHDDSVLLNRDEKVVVFEDKAASEIAESLISEYGLTPQVDDTPAAGGALTRYVVQRGTNMQLLRQLARRNGMWAYVKPGPDARHKRRRVCAPERRSERPAGNPAARLGPQHRQLLGRVRRAAAAQGAGRQHRDRRPIGPDQQRRQRRLDAARRRGRPRSSRRDRHGAAGTHARGAVRHRRRDAGGGRSVFLRLQRPRRNHDGYLWRGHPALPGGERRRNRRPIERQLRRQPRQPQADRFQLHAEIRSHPQRALGRPAARPAFPEG